MLNGFVGAARAALLKMRWNWLGPVLALGIITVSVVVLVHVLRDIAIDEIGAAFMAIPPENLVRAGLFVALAYGTLTFYDWFALRTIGKPTIPYRIAAMSAFCSYTIGHNVGATVFSAGAIRWRIYSHFGLGAIDVAKLCFVTGLTFWLGNLAVLGMAMTWDPAAVSAVDQLAPIVNRAIGLALLGALVAYVAWVWRRRRRIGWKAFEITLPGGRSTLIQIGIGITDLTCCALAMYMLVPNEPPIHIATLAAVFVSATLLGFASHAPGSIGVFDAAMLVGLSVFDKEELIAGLLVFRLMYFVTPFACALTIMGTREVALALRRRRKGA